MPFQQVRPVVDLAVRSLCIRPYPGHHKGCPNYGKKKGCPPVAPLLGEVLDLDRPVFAVWNAFDFGAHIERMRAKHPDWSERQLACCLYWQGTARKQRTAELAKFMHARGTGWCILTCPEANGVNVTETMRTIGIELEWPPKTVAYQVALVGQPAKGR